MNRDAAWAKLMRHSPHLNRERVSMSQCALRKVWDLAWRLGKEEARDLGPGMPDFLEDLLKGFK